MIDAISALCVVLVFSAVVAGAFLLLRRIAPSATQQARIAASLNWQMSTRQNGREVHLIPDGDGIAHEERWGECPCGPTLGNFTTDDHLTGWLYIHKPELAEVKR